MAGPKDGGTKLHPSGVTPRPRHPSGKPTITPLKPKLAPRAVDEDEVPRATRHLYGQQGGGSAVKVGAKVGDWISGSPGRAAAPAPAPARQRSLDETWEIEAAEELASDMWLDELEFRMNKVYEKVGQKQFSQFAEQQKAAEDDELGMTNAFEADLVKDQQAWMQELEKEIAAVYENMGKEAPKQRPAAAVPEPEPEPEPPARPQPAEEEDAASEAASAPSEPVSAASVSNLVDGLESLRAVAAAEDGRASLVAEARAARGSASTPSAAAPSSSPVPAPSPSATAKLRVVAEAEEARAREEAIARSRKEAEEQRLAARMQKNKKQAAADLKRNQAQRVHDLREANKGEASKAAAKQKLVSDICDKLQRQVKNKSFPQAMEAFGIKIVREDGDGKRLPEAEAMAKAYKKAMVKYHPDRAQQRGLGEEALLEAEETYKLIQNLYETYRRKPSAAAPKKPQYAQRQHARRQPRPAPSRAAPSGGGGGGGPQRSSSNSGGSASDQRAKDSERYKPDWQRRAESAAREHARPKEHREQAKHTPGPSAPSGGEGGGRQAKQDAAHNRARYRHAKAEDGAELRREVERRPRARRVAEQALRELVRRERLWFRNAREKQQLRDILFAKAMKGGKWAASDEQQLQAFVGTLRAYT